MAQTQNSAEFCKSNIKEVRSKKKEEADASGPLGLASLSTSSSGTSSPGLSPPAKESEIEISCRGVRREIMLSRPEIGTENISYMRLSLLAPKAQDHDGTAPTRWAINMDVSFNDNTKFQKFKWRLTNKRSEYYANIPEGWEHDLAYGSAWEYFNELTYTKWIGKACYRLEKRAQAQKLKLAPLTSIVMWNVGEILHYKLWIENAEVAGTFTWQDTSKFVAYSEPVHNFKAKEIAIIQI